MSRHVKDIDVGILLMELVSNVPMVKPIQAMATNADVIQLIFAMKRKQTIVIQKLRVRNNSLH